jgi:hypothetical protein
MLFILKSPRLSPWAAPSPGGPFFLAGSYHSRVAWLLLRMVVGVVAFVVGRGAGVGSSRAGGSQIYLSARGCALVLSSLCFFDGQPLAAFKHFLVDDKFASTAGHNSSEIMAAPTAVGVSGDGDTEIGAATLGVRASRSYMEDDLNILNFWLSD